MRTTPRSRVALVAIGVSSIALLSTGLSTLASALPGPDQSLSATMSSIYQTNNTVHSVVVSNGVVYAGGLFTSVRPPGSALGSHETPRSHIAAFSTTTGVPTSFAPTLNGNVYSLALSADGSKLYAAGAFTQVNGQTRNHFAAFDLATGVLDPTWAPSATSGSGYSIAVSPSAVYLGGTFTKVNKVTHLRIAAVNTTTGALLPAFVGSADNEVAAIAVPSDASRVIMVGSFNTIDGQPLHGSVSLNPATGAIEPWAANGILPNTALCTSTGTAVIIVGTTAYVSGDGAQPGCYDGDFAANVSDGTVIWNSPCGGATEALAVMGGVLYKGSHMHDCSYTQGGKFGGFSGGLFRSSFTFHHLIAQNPADGSFEHWSPDTNGANGTKAGPYALATDGTQLFLGGDFTTVNSKPQEGLARWAPGPSAPPARPTAAPTAVASGPGDITVTFPAVVDNDTGFLTYTLFRGTTVIATMTAESWVWAQPTLRFTDTGRTPGTSYTYHYQARDGTTTTVSSPYTPATTALASVPAYAPTVLAAAPTLDWRLDDAGPAVADASGHGNTGQFVGGVTAGVPGAIAGDAAVAVDGTTGYVASNAPLAPLNAFTESAWFDTSTEIGGSIFGASANQQGIGSVTNDVVWMDDDGQLVFAVKNSTSSTIFRTPRTYNDGRWHQVTATYDGTTMSLYVDGSLAVSGPATASAPLTGYFRVGSEDLSGITHVFGANTTNKTAPNSYVFAGSIDEAAVYPTVLTASQIMQQWASGALAP